MKTKKKVSEIEFHFTAQEANDCILRAAELIKEGYNVKSFHVTETEFYCTGKLANPNLHLVLETNCYVY